MLSVILVAFYVVLVGYVLRLLVHAHRAEASLTSLRRDPDVPTEPTTGAALPEFSVRAQSLARATGKPKKASTPRTKKPTTVRKTTTRRPRKPSVHKL